MRPRLVHGAGLVVIKSASQLFQEQMWRELQAAHKANQSEQIKKQYDKHREAVMVSLAMVKAHGERKSKR